MSVERRELVQVGAKNIAEKPEKILSSELAAMLNMAYLGRVDDETSISDLRMNRAMLKDSSSYEGFDDWARAVKRLTKEQKKQLNTVLLFAARAYKNVGEIRTRAQEDMLLKELPEERVIFLKQAFAKKQPSEKSGK